MFKFLSSPLLRSLCLIALALSACQPIQPVASSATAACSDADKIALLQAYVAAYANRDPVAAAQLFLPHGKLTVEVAPRPDGATGAYKVPSLAEDTGYEGVLSQIQLYIDGFNLVIQIETPTVAGNTVTAVGTVATPGFLWLGTPATEIAGTFTATVQNCQIAHLHWAYTQEALDALPAQAQALANQCSDEYKVALFQQYVNGVSIGDAELAALPWAEDGHLRFDGPPRFVESTQEYIIDPSIERNFKGMAAIKQTIDYLISVELQNNIALDSLTIAGSTLTVSDTVSTPAFIGEPWFLPLNELDGVYTAQFNENCKLAAVHHAYTDEVLTKLKEAKLAQ